MQAELLGWYAENGRDLPWRRTRDPYAILVSEVMLQQTQAARVVPRYLDWLERWPSAEALAAAPTAEVLRAWQGLGYNRRALNLQRAARAVSAGGWPDDLISLPGVGRYTADAVACFAFGRPVLPVDVNVRRVLERTGSAFDYRCAQALMDLGATVCIARVPRCGECPLADGHAVGIGQVPTRVADLRVGAREQVERRSALPLVGVGREKRADVTEAGGAEQRVDQRVRDHVAVGVAREPSPRVDLDPAENERHTLDERVRVDADSHPHPSGSWRRSRRSKT